MTKKDLVDALATQQEMPKVAVEGLLTAYADLVVKTAKKTGECVVPGLGKVAVKKQAARTCRNIRTGEAIKVKAKKAPKFRFSTGVKEAVK